MSGIDWEVVATAAILIFFGYVLWRGGSGNPVGTGQLQNQINTLGSKVRDLSGRVDRCATSADIERLGTNLVELERRAASSGEMVALEGQIQVLRAEIKGVNEMLGHQIDGVKETGKDTRDGVRRIEAILMKGALDR